MVKIANIKISRKKVDSNNPIAQQPKLKVKIYNKTKGKSKISGCNFWRTNSKNEKIPLLIG